MPTKKKKTVKKKAQPKDAGVRATEVVLDELVVTGENEKGETVTETITAPDGPPPATDTPAVTITTEPTEEPLSFTHDQLLQALYWIHDSMNRGMINFFVIGSTADAIKNDQKLSGDRIFLGVRRMEWENEPGDDGSPGVPSGGRRLVDSVVQYIEDEGSSVYYLSNSGVPVQVIVFEDEPTITSLDQKMYNRVFVKLPNPYGEFRETYQDFLY